MVLPNKTIILSGKCNKAVLPLCMFAMSVMVSGCNSIERNTAPSFSLGSGAEVSKDKLNLHQRYAAKSLQMLAESKPDKASEYINNALRLKPSEADYHLLNAVTYHIQAVSGNSGSLELAEQGYRMAIKFDPSNWMAWYMLGRVYLERSDFPRAKQVFAEALLIEKNDPSLLRAMAFTAYRDGDAPLAGAMIERLEGLDAMNSALDYQNAALVYAALGDQQRVYYFWEKMESANSVGHRVDRVNGRINDWRDLHQSSAGFIQTAASDNPWVTPPPIDDSNPESPWLASEPAPIAGDDASGLWAVPNWSAGSNDSAWGGNSAGGASDVLTVGDGKKMVVVDVVIINTEETMGTTKGLNLLSGLKVQFGSASQPAWSDGHSQTKTRSVSEVSGGSPFVTVSETVTDTITEIISVPALSYSLNIFNTNSQRNEILARPTIVAMEGRPSKFFSGVELNAAAVSEGQVGGQSVQIQKQIGVSLGVTPRFLEDGRVELDVNAERTFLKTPSSDVNFTFRIETSKTNVNANVVMRYGETVILSGLSEKESERTRDGVPLLQDIPLLQYFFSARNTKEFQRSVLILLTPRPAQYVYQPENARAEYEASLSEDERPLANLRARYSDWFQPYPNWASVFRQLQENGLYREFRTGDVELEQWHTNELLRNRLKQSLDFLWY